MSSLTVFFEQSYEICARVGSMSSTSQINLVQNDKGPKLNFTIKGCDGQVIETGVSAVWFHLKRYCGTKTNCGHEATSGVDPSNGKWTYCLEEGDISGVGTYFGDLEIIYDNGCNETSFEPIRIFVREGNKGPC